MNSLLHHQPSNIAANNYDHKVKNRVLLVDNPPAPDALQHTRREQRAQQSRKRKSKTMSAKERKESGAWDVPKKECKFQQFVPLHALWKGYISELFADCGSMPPQMVLPRMLKADYHGAQLSVAKAKCPTFVGLSGIVVKETENMFIIVTPKDAVKTIPKKGTVFTFVANNKIFTLYGNQFCFRAGERAARKFKDKPTVDL
ncbi:Rof/RNase P-like protein [Powellomyces hirtus]|nr:Rof/RNase P-like protein [Powellomyces hirtus]